MSNPCGVMYLCRYLSVPCAVKAGIVTPIVSLFLFVLTAHPDRGAEGAVCQPAGDDVQKEDPQNTGWLVRHTL